jgi:hypothetical protein
MMDSLKDPVVLQAKLDDEFGRYFVCVCSSQYILNKFFFLIICTQHTCVQLMNGQLWIRLGIYDDVKKGDLPAATNSTYMVYYPHSAYIFVSHYHHAHQ